MTADANLKKQNKKQNKCSDRRYCLVFWVERSEKHTPAVTAYRLKTTEENEKKIFKIFSLKKWNAGLLLK